MEKEKKYRGREKGNKGQRAAQGDRERKDGRGNGAERERQKKQQEEAGQKDSKRKKERDRELDRDGKKSSGDTRKETEREGHKRIDEDSGRMETQNKTWDGQPGWAGSGSESRRKEKLCCGAAEGDGERQTGTGSRAEKRREKISDGEQGRALGRGK